MVAIRNWQSTTQIPKAGRGGKAQRPYARVSEGLICSRQRSIYFFRRMLLVGSYGFIILLTNPDHPAYVSSVNTWEPQCGKPRLSKKRSYLYTLCWPKSILKRIQQFSGHDPNHVALFFQNRHSGLRHYPRQFGQKLVEMFDGLISSKTGMPVDPMIFPPACSTFSQMSFDDMWMKPM